MIGLCIVIVSDDDDGDDDDNDENDDDDGCDDDDDGPCHLLGAHYILHGAKLSPRFMSLTLSMTTWYH